MICCSYRWAVFSYWYPACPVLLCADSQHASQGLLAALMGMTLWNGWLRVSTKTNMRRGFFAARGSTLHRPYDSSLILVLISALVYIFRMVAKRFAILVLAQSSTGISFALTHSRRANTFFGGVWDRETNVKWIPLWWRLLLTQTHPYLVTSGTLAVNGLELLTGDKIHTKRRATQTLPRAMLAPWTRLIRQDDVPPM